MTSALGGGRGYLKSRCSKGLREFYTVNQTQMQTRGEGVKNPEHFVDVICTWPLTIFGWQYLSGENGQ